MIKNYSHPIKVVSVADKFGTNIPRYTPQQSCLKISSFKADPPIKSNVRPPAYIKTFYMNFHRLPLWSQDVTPHTLLSEKIMERDWLMLYSSTTTEFNSPGQNANVPNAGGALITHFWSDITFNGKFISFHFISYLFNTDI